MEVQDLESLKNSEFLFSAMLLDKLMAQHHNFQKEEIYCLLIKVYLNPDIDCWFAMLL